jgi:hypothetical protein
MGQFVSAFWASIAYLTPNEGFYWRLGRVLAISACLVTQDFFTAFIKHGSTSAAEEAERQ